MTRTSLQQHADHLEIAALGGAVDVVMQAIVDRLRVLVGADGSALLLPQGDVLLFNAVCGTAEPLLGAAIPIDDSIVGSVMNGREPRAVGDIESEPGINRGALTTLRGGSVACAPVRWGDRARGVIAVHSAAVDAFDDEALAVLHRMADAAAISLRNAEAVADLTASGARYRTIVDQAADPMLVSDSDGTLTSANAAAADLLGYTVDELESMHRADLVEPQEVAEYAVRLAELQAVGQLRGTRFVRRKDGTSIEVEYSTRLLSDGRVHTTLRDVTQRNRTEIALRENVARLREIVETQREISELGLEHDLDAVIDSIAHRVQRLTRADGAVVQWFESDELVYKFASGLAEPHIGRRLQIDQSLAGFASATGATEHCVDAHVDPRVDREACARVGIRSLICAPLRRGGEIVGILSVMAAAPNAFDDLVVETTRLMASFVSAAVANAEELHARERTTIALRESEARFRSAWESAAVGMALQSLDGRFLSVNASYCAMVGYTEDELVGIPFSTITHPEDAPVDARRLRSLLEGEVSHVQHEKRYIRKDGAVVWGHLTASIVRDERGEPLHLVAQVQDVTERKELETSLEESEHLFTEAFESSLVPEFVLDDERRIVDANPKAGELLGRERDALVGARIDDIVPSENLERTWQKLLADGSLTGELTFTRPDGSTCTVEYSATADVQPGRHYALLRDLTGQRELEVQLRQAQKMEAVGRLAGGIAHDFNNLLTAISGYSEFLIAGIEDDGMRRNAEEVKRAADRAAGLTNQLLAFSRRQVLQPRVLDLNAVVGDMRMMLRRLIGEDVELLTLLDPDLDALQADPSQLEQVIVNLAVNARDAMPGGGTLTIETANVDDRELGRCIALTIADTGVGMSDDARQNLFEPFFTTKGVAGTGLGLSTVLGIVEQSGGTIEVDTAQGSGTTFCIRLPRVERPAEPTIVEPPPNPPERGTETILLVEDEEIVRTLVTEILEGNGYEVLVAADGPSALELVRRHAGALDLVVTDVVMPGMSGREVAQAVASLRPGTQVLYISGYTDSVIDQHGVLDPGTSFLQKPFSASDLAHTVRALLDERVASAG